MLADKTRVLLIEIFNNSDFAVVISFDFWKHILQNNRDRHNIIVDSSVLKLQMLMHANPRVISLGTTTAQIYSLSSTLSHN